MSDIPKKKKTDYTDNPIYNLLKKGQIKEEYQNSLRARIRVVNDIIKDFMEKKD